MAYVKIILWSRVFQSDDNEDSDEEDEDDDGRGSVSTSDGLFTTYEVLFLPVCAGHMEG